jgi:hypothetical protein
MSFWSGLGKVLKIGAGIAAAPATGGLSLIPTALDAGGAMLSAAGQASASNRGAQTAATLHRDRLGIEAESDYQNSLLKRAELEMKQREMDQAARLDAAKQAILADRMKHWAPAERPSFSGGGFKIPTISFTRGIGEGGMKAVEELERQALIRQLQGETFEALPELTRYQLAELPKASTWEKLANILGPTLNVAGAISGMRQDKK